MQTFRQHHRVATFAKSLNGTLRKKIQKQDCEYSFSTNIQLKPLDANSYGSCAIRSQNEISRKQRNSKHRSSSLRNIEDSGNTCKSTGLAFLDTNSKFLAMQTLPRHRSDACEDALALSLTEIPRKQRRSTTTSKQRSSSLRNIESCGGTRKNTGLAVLDTSNKILGMETSPRHRNDACEDALALSLTDISRKQRRSEQRSSSFKNIEACGNTRKNTGMAVLDTSNKILGMETSPRHRNDACEDALALSLNTTLGKNRVKITKLEKKEDANNRVKSKVSCPRGSLSQECSLSSRGKSSAITQRLRKLGMTNRSGEWIKMRDNDGYIYYYNNKTFEAQWESPFRYQKIPLPWSLRNKDGVRMYINSKTGQELQEARSANGDVYFYDHATGQSQWEKPWEKRGLIKLARRPSNQDLHEYETHNEKSKKDVSTNSSINKMSRTGGLGYSSRAGTPALPSIHKPLIH